ncbi:MAG TPA: FAD-dependent oxidoreductase [Candidatus Xenobia bacterium]|nr:FAD-dependent oxidoreductase [Candidatus Xenobia bacterium]
MIATRMRNTAFKRVLKELQLETQVSLDGPFGLLTLHPDASRPAVFLAGGIGITPFRSILWQATQERLMHRLLLFYSNRRPHDAPFLQELQELEKQNPNFTLVATMTQMQESDESWKGHRGYINGEMLATYTKDLNSPIYYMAGPPGMVNAMRGVLKDASVDQKSIRSEEFAGY